MRSVLVVSAVVTAALLASVATAATLTLDRTWTYTGQGDTQPEGSGGGGPWAPPPCVKPGDTVTVKMCVSGLTDPVNTCQALIGFEKAKLIAGPGCVLPGGGFWDSVVYNSWDMGNGVAGQIDTVLGVNAHGRIGTTEDGKVAIINLTAAGEGWTQVVFRPDGSPQTEDNSTYLLTIDGNFVYPDKNNTSQFVIDGSGPCLKIVSVMQDAANAGINLLQSEHHPVVTSAYPDGSHNYVTITVTASDPYSGLAPDPSNPSVPKAPFLTVTAYEDPNGPSVVSATGPGVEGPSGVWTWTYNYTITDDLPQGMATIEVSAYDNCCNKTTTTGEFLIAPLVPVTVKFLTLSSSVYTFNRDVTFNVYDCDDELVGTYEAECVEFTNNPTASWKNPNFPTTTFKGVASATVYLGLPGMPIEDLWYEHFGTLWFDDDFKLDLTAQTDWTLVTEHDLDINCHSWLGSTKTFSLLGGDLNNTNKITSLDYNLLSSVFGQNAADWRAAGWCGDINGDGWVNSFDFMVQKLSFNLSGD